MFVFCLQMNRSLVLCRLWRGLYNRFDRGMHPRQSVEDYLRAIQEETQQLEEQLASHKQVEHSCKTILQLICPEAALCFYFPWSHTWLI